MNKVYVNPMNFSPVIKCQVEMEEDMVKSILKWAKDTSENKEKFKDENVNILNLRMLQITLKKISKRNIMIKMCAGM